MAKERQRASSRGRKQVLWVASLMLMLVLVLTIGTLASSAAGDLSNFLQPTPPTVPTVPTIPPPGPALNEVLGRPTVDHNGDASIDNGDQFIELNNYSASTYDISGWKLVITNNQLQAQADPEAMSPDALYVFPAGTTIPAGGFLAVFEKNTGLLLGVNGALIQLLSPDGIIVEQFNAGAFSLGQSFAKKPDGTGPWFVYCDPTPGSSNIAAVCGVPTAVELTGVEAQAQQAEVQWTYLALAGVALLLLGAYGWRHYRQAA